MKKITRKNVMPGVTLLCVQTDKFKTGYFSISLLRDLCRENAAKDAIMQISARVNGLNGGGKIGICRGGEHLSVCIFMSAGLLHLNEVVIGLGHRAIAE